MFKGFHISKQFYPAPGFYPGALSFWLRCVGIFIATGVCGVGAAQKPAKPFNVLFITVDDLRPELGCYGVTQIQTPAIDKLADRGVLFQNAYCQSAICGPSRASLLTGLRPDSCGVHDLFTSVRSKNPKVVTLPQLFKEHGYKSVSFGKVFHDNAQSRDSVSWSEKEWSASAGAGRGYLLGRNQALASQSKGRYAAPFERADVDDTAYGDGKIAMKAIDWLRKNSDKPFFMAVGFNKPHLPYNAPSRYWNLYDSAKLTLPWEVTAGVINNGIDKSLPRFPDFSNSWGEIAQYDGIDKSKPIPPDMARLLKWAYYACISYMDEQVGKLLQEIKELGLSENTIIVLWGDHGYKLGEYGGWAKHTNLSIDTRVPLIICHPGMGAAGKKVGSLVEMIDLYPTLADAAGFPLPGHLQGKSVLPLLQDPSTMHKEVVFSQFSDWNKVFRGYSLRNSNYRYTVWYSTAGADSGMIIGRELYDLKRDKEERVNICADKKNGKLLSTLHEMIVRENRLEGYPSRRRG